MEISRSKVGIFISKILDFDLFLAEFWQFLKIFWLQGLIWAVGQCMLPKNQPARVAGCQNQPVHRPNAAAPTYSPNSVPVWNICLVGFHSTKFTCYFNQIFEGCLPTNISLSNCAEPFKITHLITILYVLF